jgi:hypothetical protein
MEVSIDIYTESLLPFSDATVLPGHTRNISLSTLHRWRLRGVRGVKLQSCLIGGRRYTSREALERFFHATTAAANGEPAPIRTPRQREKAIEQAEKELGERL